MGIFGFVCEFVTLVYDLGLRFANFGLDAELMFDDFEFVVEFDFVQKFEELGNDFALRLAYFVLNSDTDLMPKNMGFQCKISLNLPDLSAHFLECFLHDYPGYNSEVEDILFLISCLSVHH